MAFHIKSRPWPPQKIKEKWQDAQLFPRGTPGNPNEPGSVGGRQGVLKGRSTAEEPHPLQPGQNCQDFH